MPDRNSRQREVVIVGGGPVGLSLALALARDGIDVLVLEKDATTAEHSRAPAIWSGTQEFLAELGVIEQFESESCALPDIELRDVDRGQVLLRLPINELADETDYARLLIVPQSTTERLLYDAIRTSRKGEVQFGSEAVAFAQDESGVDVHYQVHGREQQVRARFVVGADGAHSMVRKALGGVQEGITYKLQVALADVAFRSEQEFAFPRVTTQPRIGVGIRIGSNLWRLILPFSERNRRPSLSARIEETVRALFPGVEYTTVWQSEFRLHRRVSSRWVDGRIVLAGDAAHLNSPVGGEGMNAGILDARSLCKALHEALAADDAGPLATYASQRRESIERGVNPFTDRLTRLLLAGEGALFRPVMKLGSVLLEIPPLRRRILRRLAMLNN